MKQIFFSVVGSLLILASCADIKSPAEQMVITGNSLKALIVKASNGNAKANDSLSGLFNLELTQNNSFNSIKIDSFFLDTTKYFFVLLEYTDPIYNRLAIYDVNTNCYLIDKSLAGKFSFDVINLSGLTLMKTVERFNTKDTLGLTRLSFYRKIDDSFDLVYRSFAELKTPKGIFNQTIFLITSDTIKTRILVPKKYKLKSKEVLFLFNDSLKTYQSEESVFDSLVHKEVTNYELRGN